MKYNSEDQIKNRADKVVQKHFAEKAKMWEPDEEYMKNMDIMAKKFKKNTSTRY